MMNNNENIDSKIRNNLSDHYIPIVLCAGFGTRLKPITNHIPKVICPIIDKPLAFFSIEKFFQAGFEKVYCNTHYLSELVEAELKACAKNFGYDPNRIVFFYEKEILGSGGGILNIFTHLNEENKKNAQKDVIAVSGDVVADFPLLDMIDTWEKREKSEHAFMLSLPAEEERDDLMCVSLDGNHVIGFGKKFFSENSKNAVPRVFSNHQIISYEVFMQKKLTAESSVSLFYKDILFHKRKKILHRIFPQTAFWFNVGDKNEYKKCLDYFISLHRAQQGQLDSFLKMHDPLLQEHLKTIFESIYKMLHLNYTKG